MSLISGNGLQNQSEILKRNLQKINYQQNLSFQAFQDKNPIIFLQILHYAIINYNVDFYKNLIDKGYELFSKSDQNFMQSVYKFLQKEYEYKPPISLEQFFTNIYLEKKLIICNDILEILIKNTTEKQKKQKQDKNISSKNLKINQENEEERISVKVVKENIPIQQNIQKSDQQYQNDEDNYEEMPRQFSQQPIQSKGGQENLQNKYLNQKQDQNQVFNQNQLNQKQNSVSNQSLQNKLEQIKQDVQEIPQQNIQIEKQKQEMCSQFSQITNKVQNLSFQNTESQEFSNSNSLNTEESYNQARGNKADRPVSARELNEVMKLIMSLSQTMQETIHKLDQYQTASNIKFQNISAQLMLLEGEIKLVRAIQENK
ncbi:hypothetical protein ABPG72_002749 [Tetrahymena utriculariae]